jgi:2-polyprenyl-6-methoxyphenol hydroxylase-like FAD-dependent oxidoreductase
MAGLLAARVLADHFEHVVVVERDLLPEGAADRKGVPQGRQFHILLARGLAILDRLFPGFDQELRAAGAVPLNFPADVLALSATGWVDRRARGWEALSATRPLIEATVRRRVRDLPGITVLDGYDATGLNVSSPGGRVEGVSVRRVDGSGDGLQIDADLVADSAGRGSRAPVWLGELGYPAPEKTQVDSNIAYATRIVRIPDVPADWKAVMLMSQPPSMPRSGYLFPVEGDRWIVALIGAAGQHPPTDEEGFAAFIRSLRHPVIADTLQQAEPLTPIRGHRGTTNRRWHFDRMPRWPEQFLVLGDAACAFNPIYGQGMTTAAVAAECLTDCLWNQRRRHRDGDLDGLSVRFQRRLARATADAWALSTGQDLRFPTTTGMRAGVVVRAQHRYQDRVGIATTEDPAVAVLYSRVLGMLERPTALLRPHVLASVVRARAGGEDLGPLPRAEVPAPALADAGT